MPLTKSVERAEQELMGKAIRELRRMADMPQSAIAEALEISTQGYGKYEAGERRFTHERLDSILNALGMTEAELEAARSKVLGKAEPQGMAERGQPFVLNVVGRSQGAGMIAPASHRVVDLRQLLGPSSGAIEVATEEMAPWAEPGEILLFDRDRYPKRGQGCIVETKDGRFLPRLYERSDGSTLFVKVLTPAQTESLQLSQVRGVYAVQLRGD